MVRVRHLKIFIHIYAINSSVFGTRNNMIEERQYCEVLFGRTRLCHFFSFYKRLAAHGCLTYLSQGITAQWSKESDHIITHELTPGQSDAPD